MSSFWLLLRREVRHLWPWLAILLTLIVFRYWVSLFAIYNEGSIFGADAAEIPLVLLLVIIGVGKLALSASLWRDPTAEPKAFWTRLPVSGTVLALAKLTVAWGLFLVLPALVLWGWQRWSGASAEYFWTPENRTLFGLAVPFIAATTALWIALAAAARTPVRFVLGIVLFVVLTVAIASATFRSQVGSGSEYLILGRTYVALCISGVVALAALPWLYSRTNHQRGCLLLGCGLLLALFSITWNPLVKVTATPSTPRASAPPTLPLAATAPSPTGVLTIHAVPLADHRPPSAWTTYRLRWPQRLASDQALEISSVSIRAKEKEAAWQAAASWRAQYVVNADGEASILLGLRHSGPNPDPGQIQLRYHLNQREVIARLHPLQLEGPKVRSGSVTVGYATFSSLGGEVAPRLGLVFLARTAQERAFADDGQIQYIFECPGVSATTGFIADRDLAESPSLWAWPYDRVASHRKVVLDGVRYYRRTLHLPPKAKAWREGDEATLTLVRWKRSESYVSAPLPLPEP